MSSTTLIACDHADRLDDLTEKEDFFLGDTLAEDIDHEMEAEGLVDIRPDGTVTVTAEGVDALAAHDEVCQ